MAATPAQPRPLASYAYDRRCAGSQAWRSRLHLQHERAPPQRRPRAVSIINTTASRESAGETRAFPTCQRDVCPASLPRVGPHPACDCCRLRPCASHGRLSLRRPTPPPRIVVVTRPSPASPPPPPPCPSRPPPSCPSPSSPAVMAFVLFARQPGGRGVLHGRRRSSPVPPAISAAQSGGATAPSTACARRPGEARCVGRCRLGRCCNEPLSHWAAVALGRCRTGPLSRGALSHGPLSRGRALIAAARATMLSARGARWDLWLC